MSETSKHDQDTSSSENAETNAPAVVEKFVIRLPKGLRKRIKELSEHNRRSMNSEIIMVLEKHIQQNRPLDISDFSEGTDEHDAAHRQDKSLTRQELSKRLEALPPEKQEALLELLG